MSSREDCGKDLFDHLVLANDHLLQLLLHDLPVLAKLFEDVAEVAGFRGQSFDPLRLEIILGRIAHAKLRGAAEGALAPTAQFRLGVAYLWASTIRQFYRPHSLRTMYAASPDMT